MLSGLTSEQAVAQPLTPEQETPCDAATASAIPLNDSEGGACARRTYALNPVNTLVLRQENYDMIEVTAWDGPTIQVETTVVARQATQDAAQADLERVTLNRETLNQEDAEASQVRLFASGPDDDAPGYWTVRYRLRVPAQTTLDISSENSSITVRDVVGSHSLRSTNGSITYHLPAGAEARFQAQTTNGIIKTDFDVGMEGTAHAYLEVVAGTGGPTVLLATTNGNVTLQRAN
jgi:hypothetical protein